MWGYMACDPSTPEVEPKDQKFKIILSYRVSPRPPWATHETLSQEIKEKRVGGKEEGRERKRKERRLVPERYEKGQIREALELGHSHRARKWHLKIRTQNFFRCIITPEGRCYIPKNQQAASPQLLGGSWGKNV